MLRLLPSAINVALMNVIKFVTLTVVGTFCVGHFSGRVVGANEARELTLEWLVGAVMTRLADLVDNIEEGSNWTVDALGPRHWIIQLLSTICCCWCFNWHAACWALVLW